MDARTNLKARLPSRHVTEGPARAPLENAAATVAPTGGSTNVAPQLPAIAHECEIEFTLFDVAEIFKKTPYIADLKPGGRYVAKDMFEVGGIPLLMKTLLDHGFLHGECMTVTGRTIAENLKSVKSNPNQDVVRPANDPITVTGGVVGLEGNLGPESAIVKVAGLKTLKLTGAARCFDGETDVTSGYLWKYAQQVGPAVYGAVTHPGGKAEKISYADA